MRQVLFEIPFTHIPIYGYGMMLFVAFIVCTWLAGRRAEKEGVAKERIQDLAIWLFVGGILGARITYILEQGPRPSSLGEFLWQLPRIWEGGIILYGSILGGLVGYGFAYWFVLRKHGLTTLKMADIMAPSIALGLAIGRIGCLLNGCCYGQVATCQHCVGLKFPLSSPARYELVAQGYQTAAGFTLDASEQPDKAVVGVVEPDSPAEKSGLRPGDEILEADGRPIHDAQDLEAYLGSQAAWPRGKTDLSLTVRHRDGQEVQLSSFHPWTLPLHPTQVYESISMVLIFLLLTAFYPFRRQPGQVMALLMLAYAVHRYLNEKLRNDPRPVGFEQYSSILLFAAGAVLLVWLWRMPVPKPAPPLPRRGLIS